MDLAKAALLTDYHHDLKIETVDDPKIISPTDVIVRVGAADHVVLARENSSHLQEIRDLAKGGAQVVLDCIGEHGVQNDAIGLLGANGVDMLIGYRGRLEVDILTQALFPETSFVGNICGTYNELGELLEIARRGAVKLSTMTFPLGDINAALGELRGGRVVGRGVLIPQQREVA